MGQLLIKRLSIVVTAVIFLSYVLIQSACTRTGSKKVSGEDQLSGGIQKIKIEGKVQAESDFFSASQEGIVTTRLVTGRIITARAPRLSAKEEEVKPVREAIVVYEEGGVSATSDDNGNFSLQVTISRKCPCEVTISAGAVRKDGKSYRVRQNITISDEDIKAGRKNVGAITVLSSGGIIGKVRLVGADYHQGVYAYIPGTGMISITDEEGNFVIGDIPPGQYKLAMEKIGYSSKMTENVVVEEGKITYVGDFELQKVESSDDFLKGVVREKVSGRVVIGAIIVSSSGKVAMSDVQGIFQIGSTKEKLTVYKEGYKLKEVFPSELTTRQVEIILEIEDLRTGVIKGKVYNWSTSKPIPGATVISLPKGDATVTLNDGSFSLQGVEPGSYNLIFIKSDFQVGVEPIRMPNGGVIDIGIIGLVPDCQMAKFYADKDGDGFGDPNEYTEDCYPPYGYVGNKNDCDDTRVEIHPGAVEICNGKDDNCNGLVDEGVQVKFYRDQDNDGYGTSLTLPGSVTQACEQPPGYVGNNLDCDDSDPNINPGVLEECNGKDDNCNGHIDEGVQVRFYRDQDNDGYGDPASKMQACTVPVGYVENNLDCDDSDPNINPGVVEVVDGRDENCDGIQDNLTFRIGNIAEVSPVHYIDLAMDQSERLYVSMSYTAYGSSRWLDYFRKEVLGEWEGKGARYLGAGSQLLYSSSIAVKPDGSEVYFSYHSFSDGSCGGGLCINKYTSGGWYGDGKGVIVAPSTRNNAIAYANGFTHIVYADETVVHIYADSSHPTFSERASIVFSGQVTDVEVSASPDGATVHMVAIVILADGEKYPFYARNAIPGVFSSWVTSRITSYTYDVESISVAVSANGVTHICFTGKNTPHLFYTQSTGGSFSIPNSIDGEGPMSSCSITLDNVGSPHVAYYSKSFKDLRYAVLYEGSWKKYRVTYVEYVPLNHGVGIVIDSKKIPYIAFIGYNLPRYATLTRKN